MNSQLLVILKSHDRLYQRAEEQLTDRLGVPTESTTVDDLQHFIWHGASANDLAVVADVIDGFGSAIRSVAYEPAQA